MSAFARSDSLKSLARVCIIALVLAFPLVASARVAPFYRLYTNALGGGMERAGTYFPHDEFYDARIREAAAEIAARARPGARVASETPGLVTYYARLRGREDIVSLSLSETEAIRQLEAGDFIIVARGRRYFSNEAEVARLEETSQPVANLSLGDIPAVKIFVLDENSQAAVSETLK